MKKIITLAQSLMQEIERYNKELTEIERVADYRYEENEQLKAQIKKMKCCENCKHNYHDRYNNLQCICNCINFDNWELAE